MKHVQLSIIPWKITSKDVKIFNETSIGEVYSSEEVNKVLGSIFSDNIEKVKNWSLHT